MSGIIGIVHGDGTPVDRHLLEDMTAHLRYRGPDATGVRVDGGAGFGHALLKTTFESEQVQQPVSLDGQVWITADARIDGQTELRERLHAVGRVVRAEATDAELILHAYHAWEEDCPRHLIGDFAFAVWDGLQRKLFCARDHFGVKPFFYARAESCLVFSNTLDCLRKHPAISGALDDLWIADFLLFERSLEPGATAYADIRRLPPAHTLSFTDSKLKIACYWSLPVDLCIRYRPQGDYVEHFKILLDQAVADRLRTDRVGVVMSGGMDSTAVAAVAQEVLRRSGQPFELDAHTVVYDRLIPDEERRYASAAASRLGIPIHYLPADDYPLFGQDVAPCIAHCPEPSNSPERAMYAEFVAQFARHSRVVLTGWDGDALLNESPLTYLRWLRAQRQFRRLLAECASLIFKRPGQVFHGIWKRLRAGKRPEQKEPEYPAWINPSLERRFAMKERWARFHGHVEPGHPLRPFAYHSYTHIQRLSNFFDGFDPGVTGQPVEYRHPLLDLRLVEYCLSLPPLPWCVRKEILRAAMKRHLPRSILKRPKTPLAGFPHLALLRQPAASWLDGFAPAPSLEKYVVRSRIPAIRTSDDPAWTWWNLRPLSLNLWLAETEPSRTRGQSE